MFTDKLTNIEPKQPLLKSSEQWYVKKAMWSVARKLGEDINKK
ncbi:hypothetical protein [Metabacillus endolithicus]